jgi:hypothetical protein
MLDSEKITSMTPMATKNPRITAMMRLFYERGR